MVGGATLPAISYDRYPGVATAPLPGTYRRREPERSVLHTVIREHLETSLEQARYLNGEGYPRFIEREFRSRRCVGRAHHPDERLCAHGLDSTLVAIPAQLQRCLRLRHGTTAPRKR